MLRIWNFICCVPYAVSIAWRCTGRHWYLEVYSDGAAVIRREAAQPKVEHMMGEIYELRMAGMSEDSAREWAKDFDVGPLN